MDHIVSVSLRAYSRGSPSLGTPLLPLVRIPGHGVLHSFLRREDVGSSRPCIDPEHNGIVHGACQEDPHSHLSSEVITAYKARHMRKFRTTSWFLDTCPDKGPSLEPQCPAFRRAHGSLDYDYAVCMYVYIYIYIYNIYIYIYVCICLCPMSE